MKHPPKNVITGKIIALMSDETFDRGQSYACCILITVISIEYKLNPILAKTFFESSTLNSAKYLN